MTAKITTKTKLVYGLRVRFTDADEWTEPIWYRTKSKRDNAEKITRIIGGIRTHSIERRMTLDEVELIEYEG